MALGLRVDESPGSTENIGETITVTLAGDYEWRRAWWDDLEAMTPEVAARLVARFPDRYPIR